MSNAYASGFQWIERSEDWQLIAPSGKSAATVFKKRDMMGHNWFVWDQNGCGGENASGDTIRDAMTQAEAATLRWGKHK